MTDAEWSEFESYVTERHANEAAFIIDDASWKRDFTFPRPHSVRLLLANQDCDYPLVLRVPGQMQPNGDFDTMVCGRCARVTS